MSSPKDNGLHSLRQQLERSYSLESEIQTSYSISWWCRLQVVWQKFTSFMVHQLEPQLDQTSEAASDTYNCKIRLYPYLPVIEEERDWLAKTYYKSASNWREFRSNYGSR